MHLGYLYKNAALGFFRVIKNKVKKKMQNKIKQMKIVIIIIIMKIRNINCICNFREYIEFRHGVYRFNPLLFTNSVKSEVLFRQHSKIKDTSGMQDKYLSFFAFSTCQRLQNKLKFYFHLFL